MQTSFNINPFNRGEIYFSKKITGLLLFLFVFLFDSCQKEISEKKSLSTDEENSSMKKGNHEKDCFSDDEENNNQKKGNHEGPATVTVFATGLNNPRGLKFGPDCHLYVAEAGLGNGTTNSDALCPRSVPYDAPYHGSTIGGRISKINANGVRTTVTDKLPTIRSSFNDILGATDVAFIGNQLYALLYAGCGHGVPSVPSCIAKINNNGTFTIIADLGAWRLSHPVAHPPTYDNDPEGAFNSMISVGNAFYTLDANHGDFVKVTSHGNINRIVDISASEGHIVPVVLEYAHGDFYMGNLGLFPIVDGSTNIYRIKDGKLKVVVKGLTAILGLVIDKKGRMYVLETSTGNDFPTPGAGKIVRVNPNGTKQVIATGLSNPTSLAYGPDGNLYVSNWGYGGEPGDGEVLKVTLHN